MSNSLVTTETTAPPAARRGRTRTFRRWSALLAKFLSVQILVQAMGLLAGILLVRKLSQTEYAFYTLANTLQATLLLLADVGVGSALSATGGQVWQDRRRFGELIQTGLHVRKKLAWVGGLIALPVLLGMLVTDGAHVPYALALCAAVLLGANFRLTNDVLTVVPRLHARVDRLQKLDVVAAAFRLLLIGAACLSFVNAAVGVLVASLSFGLQTVLLRPWAAAGADPAAPTSAEDYRTIVRVIRQQAPNTLYYCVQGQLMVFLVSLFGSTRTLAEVGALGRLAVFFSLAGSIMSSIVLPRFARCQDKTELKRMWWQIMGGFVLLSLVLLATAVLLPGPFLWLLGKQYAHLERELDYVVLSTVINTLYTLVYSLNAARAWMKGAWHSIPITIGTQIILIPLLDLGSVQGAALLSCIPAALCALPFLFRAYRSFQEMPQ